VRQSSETKLIVFNDPNTNPADLIEHHARNCGELFAREEKGSKTQLRRFYQEYQSLRERIKNEEDYEKYAPAVKMMLSKVAYAWRGGGKDAKISKSFHDWLTNNVQAINSAEDVQKFGYYFEAVVGYYYGANNERGGGGNRQ
jgi:CRISPR type III-A-associated protein Csm2